MVPSCPNNLRLPFCTILFLYRSSERFQRGTCGSLLSDNCFESAPWPSRVGLAYVLIWFQLSNFRVLTNNYEPSFLIKVLE